MFTLSSACLDLLSLVLTRHGGPHLPTIHRSIFEQRVTSGRQLKAHMQPTNSYGKVMSLAYLRARVKNEK